MLTNGGKQQSDENVAKHVEEILSRPTHYLFIENMSQHSLS